MPYNVLESITAEERLNFAQNFSVARPGILDTIFPDVKTPFWKAEYYRLMAGQRLPEVAFVHALDTEAEIGSRPGFEKVLTEKLFIKRKSISLSVSRKLSKMVFRITKLLQTLFLMMPQTCSRALLPEQML